MLKKVIEYEGFDGMETEDAYFHLGASKLIEMETGVEGGISGRLEEISKSGDGGKIITEFKKIVLESYGQRDGNRFVQTPELAAEFGRSLAFDALLLELVTDPTKAAEFVNGIMPKELAKIAGETTLELPEAEDSRPAWEKEDRAPTHAEVKTMTEEQLKKAFREKAASK